MAAGPNSVVSTVTIPSMFECRLASARAAVFGLKSSCRIASSTRWRVCGRTWGWSLMTRDTVMWETPARRATSVIADGRVALSEFLPSDRLGTRTSHSGSDGSGEDVGERRPNVAVREGKRVGQPLRLLGTDTGEALGEVVHH